MIGDDVPALQSIHELAWSVEALSHEGGLLAHCDQGILEEACLVLRRNGSRRHVEVEPAG